MRSDPKRLASLACVAGAVLVTILAGCSSSVPRFKSGAPPAPVVVQDDDEFRFASKVREEEMREDDRKVDVNSMKKKLTPASRPPSPRYTNLTPAGLNRDQVLLDAVSFLGTPYAYGGSTKNGIDCSGFTSSVYANAVRKQLPRSTREQYRVGSSVGKNELQFGDLVFFNTTGRSPSHVGIYIEDDLFVHASVSYGVTISSLESSYYKKRFIGARRLVE
jgi:cell wall-associated NlpC family hydrolase